MPQTKQIIFLKGKMREDVKYSGFDKGRGLYYVLFNKGDEYLYYKPENVDIAEFTRQMDPPLRVTRKKDGFVFSNVLGVRVFEGKEHKAYRVVYENNKANSSSADYVEIEEHIDDARSINVWEYLNEVAKHIIIPIDDDNTIAEGVKAGLIKDGRFDK